MNYTKENDLNQLENKNFFGSFASQLNYSEKCATL